VAYNTNTVQVNGVSPDQLTDGQFAFNSTDPGVQAQQDMMAHV
jgi:hypothetical protein